MTVRTVGRRRGTPQTRAEIVDAARAAFAQRGFDATSLRSIARAAGVDAALVHHYFSSKHELFAACIEPPVDPARLVATVADDPVHAGERMASLVLGLLDDADVRDRFVAMLRAAATDATAARVLRDMVDERIAGPAAKALGGDHPDMRATLVGSLLVGLVFARCIVGVEPLASIPAEILARALGPVLQHYLTGDLS